MALAAGELGAAGAYQGFKPFRQSMDVIPGVGQPGGGVDLFEAGAGFAVFDIFPDAAAEEQHLLRHDRDLAAEGAEGEGTNWSGIKKDLAGLRLAEAEDEGEDGGFPRAGGTHEGDPLAGLDVEAEVAENEGFRTGRVTEGEVFES